MNYEVVATAGPGVVLSHAIVTMGQALELLVMCPGYFTLTIATTFGEPEVFHG